MTKDELVAMFVNRKVRVSDTNRGKFAEGICIAIHETGSLTPYDIELDDHHRIGFSPITVTDTSCEGPLGVGEDIIRKIEVI